MSETVKIPYFLSDYDGTIAHTDEFPVGGVGVDGAYMLAIGHHKELGPEAVDAYIAIGGHNSRSALQIVTELRPDLSADDLIHLARDVYHDQIDILTAQFGKPTANGDPWPAFTDGFIPFYEALLEERAMARPIATGIVSSGYRDFIHRSFLMHDLEPPDVIVATEAIDALHMSLPPELRGKPNPLSLEMAKTILHQTYPHDTAERPVVYVGDSLTKDRKLASNTGSHFIRVETDNPGPAWAETGRWLELDKYMDKTREETTV